MIYVELSSSIPVPISLKRAALKAANAILKKLPKSRLRPLLNSGITRTTITVAFVSPREIQTLNRKYRGKDKVTDVLSFSRIHAGKLSGEVDAGDIVLCLLQTRKQARERNISAKEEVMRLTIHGVLHLFGYDHDEGPRQARHMFSIQESVLKRITS